MKLLSPFQTKDRQDQEIARKILRIQEIESLAKEANAKLARADLDFAEALARSREKWALEVEEKQKMAQILEGETIALEKRKEQALIPISMYRQEADKLLAEAQEIVKRAKEKEEMADFLQEKLEIKLTDISDREHTIIEEEKRLVAIKAGMENQEEHTKQGVERLSKEMIKFHEEREAWEVSHIKND